GDALAELAQAAVVELVAELGLADEDDLEELPLVGLEVREEADLLEEVELQVLGLVDHQHDVVALGELLQEEAVEHLQVGDAVGLRRLQAELVEDRLEELVAGQDRVQDEGGLHLRPQLLQDGAADGGLPGAHLAGELDEALALADAEEDVVERLP